MFLEHEAFAQKDLEKMRPEHFVERDEGEKG
jgi:hypothetical protein